MLTSREIADMILNEHQKFVNRFCFKEYLDISMGITITMLYGIAYDMILRGEY